MNKPRLDEIAELKEGLRRQGYFIDDATALTVAVWLEDRSGPLILEGPPGSGKTSLAKCLAAAKGAPLYRLECYKSIGRREALYDWDERLQEIELNRWVKKNGELPETPMSIIYHPQMMIPGVLTRALGDTNLDIFVLINELDKIPGQEAFEALLLEYLDEHAITVLETGERIRPAAGKPPHTIITSNAGVAGASLRDSLSYPVLRRGKYIYLPEADSVRQYEILRQAAPTLDHLVLRDVVLFVERASAWELEKPIALSETIMWARSLEWLGVTELTEQVVYSSLADLAKSREDADRLRSATKYLLHYVQSRRTDSVSTAGPITGERHLQLQEERCA
jgi:MoxR-like ATPase